MDKFFYAKPLIKRFKHINLVSRITETFLKDNKKLFTQKSKKLKVRQIILALIAGVFVGFLSGFFGGGGGMIVVPILVFVMGLKERQAHATAIFTILPLTIVS